jgi:hypothetical protein
MSYLGDKRKSLVQDSPNKKQKTKKQPSSVTVPMKVLFSKDSPGKGRPPLLDEVIDVLADLQTKNYVSANQVGDVLKRCGDFWWSKSDSLPPQVLSKQSALRSMVIKGLGGDYEIAKILSKASEIWIGTDGGSEDDRHFIELHVMGMVDGEYFTHFINVIEREHFNGQEVASWISGQFEFYSKIQRELKIRETFLYHISGIVLDTTSANTGKYNGVAVCLERLRQTLHDAHFKKKCSPLEVKTDDTHKD